MFSNVLYMTTTEQPTDSYIDADTYTGRWSQRATGGRRGQVWTVEALHAILPTDGTPGIIWTSYGTVSGTERFGRERVIARADGIYTYTSEGPLIQIRPLGKGRTVRILVK